MDPVSSSISPPKPRGVFHGIFAVVVVAKALDGLVEIASGATLVLAKAGTILEWVNWMTQSEILEDPHTLYASILRNWASRFGYDAQLFDGHYLLVHGTVKLVLALLLLTERGWVFPLALVLFTALVAFLAIHLVTNWSWPSAVFAALDILTIAVIAKEWLSVRRLRSKRAL